MGVELSARAKTELSAAAPQQSVNAQTALAQGITAQRQGTEAAALSYYIQSNNYDPGLAEAASRLNVLSANISSGNMGEDVRNDIQWRRNWIARLEECERYFANYMREPAPYTLVYSTDLKQGKVDYEKETIDINGVTIYLIANRTWFAVPEQVVYKVWAGITNTGRTREWGLNWPSKSIAGTSPFVSKEDRFNVTAELCNDQGKVIGRQNVMLPYGWKTNFSRSNGMLTVTPVDDSKMEVTFPAVKVDDITDKLNINIAGINGENVQTASRDKRISIMPADEYRKILNSSFLDEYRKNNNSLFPLDGVTLGKTTVQELARRGTISKHISNSTGKPYNYYTINGVDVWFDENSGLASHYSFIDRPYGNQLPQKWVSMGMSFENSYEEWVYLANMYNWTVEMLKPPVIESGRFKATIELSYRKDGVLYIIRLFFISENGGTKKSDNNTLYQINVSYKQ
jgi:hypothetical protein